MTASLFQSKTNVEQYADLWRDYWQTRWHRTPDWRETQRFNALLGASEARSEASPLVYDYPQGKRPFLGVLSMGEDGAPSQDAGVLEFPDAGHLLTIAPTRTGKGVSQIIPNLLFYAGSAFVIDIKGENYDITGEHRAQMFPGAKVIKFSPFEEQTDRYNPLDFVRTADNGGPTPDTFEDCRLIAEMLLPKTGKSKDEYWDLEARNILTSILMYVVCRNGYASDARTMRSVVDVLYVGDDEEDMTGIEREFVTMQVYAESINYRPLHALATAFLGHHEKVASSILSTCRAGMQIWLSDRLLSATDRSDFRFSDLKKSMCRPIDEDPAPTTIYVIIPPEYLNEYRSVLRMMTGLAAVELTRFGDWVEEPGWRRKPPCSVLFLLDEFPALGEMTPIANGLAYLAGYGVQLWPFAQSIGQLKSIYGEAWQNFPANAGATSFFGVNDPDTAAYVERLLGETSETLQHYYARGYYNAGSITDQTGQSSNTGSSSGSNSSNQYSSGFSTNRSDNNSSGTSSSTSRVTNLEHEADRINHRYTKWKIATAADVRALPEELQFVFIRNRRPILSTKLPHYQFELLEGLYSTWKRG
ncbi:type IV secretory system conjugative DNA transfer family protein [Maricaulis maris]|jgi:type IV secretion system protein VirD4|uniref:type IV secretory system conjugative DNA transfer family protein n=1 Tax=Maricaulis maris TaxID=74318 RepID=UPI003A92739D